MLVCTAVAALVAIQPAFCKAPARIRGTIIGIDDGSITVKERDGRTFTLKTGPYTAYAYVVPSGLDEIKVSDFVGSAVKGPLNSMVAVDLLLAPRRGEGHHQYRSRFPGTPR